MKITRIELCHPVNRPGKRDDNYRELPPPGDAEREEEDRWSLELSDRSNGFELSSGVVARQRHRRMLIPMSNIKSIDYEETKKK